MAREELENDFDKRRRRKSSFIKNLDASKESYVSSPSLERYKKNRYKIKHTKNRSKKGFWSGFIYMCACIVDFVEDMYR